MEQVWVIMTLGNFIKLQFIFHSAWYNNFTSSLLTIEWDKFSSQKQTVALGGFVLQRILWRSLKKHICVKRWVFTEAIWRRKWTSYFLTTACFLLLCFRFHGWSLSWKPKEMFNMSTLFLTGKLARRFGHSYGVILCSWRKSSHQWAVKVCSSLYFRNHKRTKRVTWPYSTRDECWCIPLYKRIYRWEALFCSCAIHKRLLWHIGPHRLTESLERPKGGKSLKCWKMDSGELLCSSWSHCINAATTSTRFTETRLKHYPTLTCIFYKMLRLYNQVKFIFYNI